MEFGPQFIHKPMKCPYCDVTLNVSRQVGGASHAEIARDSLLVCAMCAELIYYNENDVPCKTTFAQVGPIDPTIEENIRKTQREIRLKILERQFEKDLDASLRRKK